MGRELTMSSACWRETGVRHLQKLADLVAIRSPKRCTERPELRSHAEW